MGRPVTINGRELNINDAPFIEANAEYSVTVDDDGTVMVERTDLKAENDRLMDERVRYEDLAHILDREWNINVEWDGVRRIWYVGLTELGVQLRDESEAVRMAHIDTINELVDKNEKLSELAAQALQIIKHVNVVMAIDYARYGALMSMARELGIEVE
jgi:hypothetical protein